MRDSDTWFSPSSLLCNEDRAWLKDEAKTCVDLDPCFVQENGDEYFEYLVERESTSSGSKSCESTSSVCSITSPNWSETARLGAIQWIFNTRAIFGFKYHTAYLSITYFDRFFSKRVVHDGQLWAIEIISLACLTLAAKMEEYTVPPLSAFWVEGHDFDSKSIKKTELMVLSTLRWNMGSITPFHYLHYFINRLCGECRPRELVSRAVELIMAITKEINLMDHRPSVIAAAAVLVIIDGRLTKKALEQKMSGISLWRSQEHDHIFSCYKIMLKIELDELETPTSTVSSNLSSTGSNSIDVIEGSSSIRVAGAKRRLPFTNHDQHCPVANSNVRQNALHVLLDMFPLEDPDSTKEAKDTLLDKQFFLLERLLMDDCPDVRLVAVEGCCRILHLFWEIIPSASITKIIMKIFDDMSHDICNEVRLSTLNGVIYLLGNPQSHEILKVLLPRLGHLMLDNVSSVRMALVDLLLLLRDMRNFQFNKVVGLDVLLSTLANDQPLVAQKITKLLMPSYFPSKLPVEEACNRCVTLIKRSPTAGARFCEFSLLGGASINSLMELIRVFISLVLSPVKLNADQIEGLLVAAAYLSRSISIEPCSENALKQLLAGEKVKFLFSAASTARAQSSVLNIVSNLASDAAAGVFEECTGLVTNCSGISDNVERQAQLRSAHKLFQSCDGFNDMFEALTVCLQKTAYRCHIKFGTEAPKNCVSSAKRKKSSSGKMSAKWKHVNRKRRSNFEEDYSIAVGIAWQIRDLLVSVDSRKAVLASQTLESSFLALKIISEASILQCVHCEYMDAYPVLAYTALALHMTLQNISINSTKVCGTEKKSRIDSSRSLLEPNVLEQTMDHLLNCIEKVLGAVNSGKSGNSSSVFEQANHKTAFHCGQTHREPQMHASSCSADDFCTEQKRLPIKVKMLTAILKSMVDATSMGFLSHYYGRFLKFTSGYVQDVVSALRRRSHDRFQFKEEDLKDIVLCLKSSFTYAAKLVNLVNRDISEASSLASEAFDLVNDLLDLVSSIELYLGSGNAASLVSAAKHWLPDLVLALGYGHILKQTRGEGLDFHASCRMKHQFPLWLLILAKSELLEISKFVSEDGEDTVSEFEEVPVSKKLLGMIVTLSKGNPSVLDAVGVMVLTGSLVGLERKDFGLVLGLLHLVCRKLFREDDREWGDMMLASLQDVYPQIEREMEEQNDEDGRQKLHCAKELLEPVWMHHIYETGRVSMTEE